MQDLIDFIRARLDEDAAIAAGAGAPVGPGWKHVRTYNEIEISTDRVLSQGGAYEVAAPGIQGGEGDVAVHIARHDPARVLAEVNAKRAILEEHAPVVDGAQSGWKWHAGSEAVSGQIVRLLGLPYADHPDYREEWRP